MLFETGGCLEWNLPADYSPNAVVASFDTLLPATVEDAVADLEISKEKETAQTRARAPGS